MQTIGSAGESVAAGVVFTTAGASSSSPDGDQYFKYVQIIDPGDLRRHPGRPLHDSAAPRADRQGARQARYPEGTACADVLIAGEKGGNLAKMVFAGFWIALGYKILYGVFGLWRETATCFRTKRDVRLSDARPSTSTSRPSTWASATSSARASPASSSRAACSPGWPSSRSSRSSCPRPRLIADLEALGFNEAWMREQLATPTGSTAPTSATSARAPWPAPAS